MKGQAWTYFGIVIVLILTSIVLLRLNWEGDVERTIITIEGKMVSFENYVELLIKTLKQSIEFNAQRAAYDLGKIGGTEPEVFWKETDPQINVLEINLENKIRENLPSSDYTKDGRKVRWGEGVIDVYDYDIPPCGPIESSECFLVDGTKYFIVYDESIDSRISVNQEINSNVDSNYFKLLNAGRAIMEDPQFNQYLNDTGALLNELYTAKANGDTRFVNLDFIVDVEIEPDEDIVTVVIVEHCYPPDTYCLAPLTPKDHAITEELHNNGDVDWDGDVDDDDQSIFNDAYLSLRGEPNWNSACDFDDDGDVDYDDLITFGGMFGKENPPYIIINGEQIPYDHVKLIFKFREDQIV